MKNPSLHALIGRLKTRGTSPELFNDANSAFDELYSLISKDLETYCCYVCSKDERTDSDEYRDEIFQQAIIRFSKNPNSFDENYDAAYQDENILLKALLKHIGQIIFWLWLDEIRKLKKKKKEQISFENVYQEQEEENMQPEIKGKLGEPVNNNLHIKIKTKGKLITLDPEIITGIIKTLKPKEQEVVITYMQYYPGIPPREVLIGLSQRTGIEYDQLRVVKARAFAKIKKKLLALDQLK